jgi:hypothetical protein
MNYQPQHPLEPGAHSAPNEARRKQELERGQAIVLIAFVMVGLIAMLGLSVDGGGILFLYRDARNATDAATLAAAYARCTNGDLEEAGLKTAADNGFNNDGMQNRVFVQNPPLDGVGAGDENYINVQIEAFKPSYFIQIVYPEPLWITTEATGFCRKPWDSSSVGAIFGISRDCNNMTVTMTGANSYIEGDIFSNEHFKMQGGNDKLNVNGNISAAGTITDDKIDYGVDENGNPYVSSAGVEPRDNPFGWFSMDDYRPGGVIWEALEEDYASYLTYIDNPGGTYQPSGTMRGLYVVEGHVNLKKGVVFDTDIGVTIIAKGSIRSTNMDTPIVYFEPLLTLNDIDIPSMGILFYSEYGDPDGSCNKSNGAVELTMSRGKMTGVIYTPNGVLSSSMAGVDYDGALVGLSVQLQGADKIVTYDPSLFPPQPPRVSIAQ